MKWLGLTGGIASGKSTAKKHIQSLGCGVVDADLISHQISQQGAAGYEQIVSHFGRSMLLENGELNRSALGSIVFSQESQRLALENILHPLIQAEVKKQRQDYLQQGMKLCFYDVPLLFEKSLQNQFEKTVLIWCDRQIQLQRLMSRNHFTFEQAMMRIQAQMPLNDKIKLSDFCIDNSGSESSLKSQIDYLIEKLS